MAEAKSLRFCREIATDNTSLKKKKIQIICYTLTKFADVNIYFFEITVFPEKKDYICNMPK